MNTGKEALKRFEIENQVKQVDDSLYDFDVEKDREAHSQKPWKKNQRYFTKVKLSTIALIKMIVHAKSGGDMEVMGLMQGRVLGDTMIVLDAFALPVEGSETRVSAGAEAMEYAVALVEDKSKIGRLENIIGWYHSHPGYGCWLSGIDVNTQQNNQMYQDPFLAIVVDPHRSMASGKVDIGAFRTIPSAPATSETMSGVKPTAVKPAVPLSKIADFGAHADQYYSLPITIVKSTSDAQLLDVLWNQYWTTTVSTLPPLNNSEFLASQISDFSEKLQRKELFLSNKQVLTGYSPKRILNKQVQTKDSSNCDSPDSPLPATKIPCIAHGDLHPYLEISKQISTESSINYISKILKKHVFS